MTTTKTTAATRTPQIIPNSKWSQEYIVQVRAGVYLTLRGTETRYAVLMSKIDAEEAVQAYLDAKASESLF